MCIPDTALTVRAFEFPLTLTGRVAFEVVFNFQGGLRGDWGAFAFNFQGDLREGWSSRGPSSELGTAFDGFTRFTIRTCAGFTRLTADGFTRFTTSVCWIHQINSGRIHQIHRFTDSHVVDSRLTNLTDSLDSLDSPQVPVVDSRLTNLPDSLDSLDSRFTNLPFFAN